MFFSSILVLALAVSRLMLSIRVAIALINSAMLVNRVATAPNMTIIVGIFMFMDSFLINKPNRSLLMVYAYHGHVTMIGIFIKNF